MSAARVPAEGLRCKARLTMARRVGPKVLERLCPARPANVQAAALHTDLGTAQEQIVQESTASIPIREGAWCHP